MPVDVALLVRRSERSRVADLPPREAILTVDCATQIDRRLVGVANVGISFQLVPEPSSVGLLLAGAFGLMMVGRRRR